MTPIGRASLSPLRFRRGSFSIPALPEGFLRRKRLIEFLRQNLQRRLILVSAGAGYGKSALLADFAKEIKFPVVWCRLDETDTDLAPLPSDLLNALQRPCAGFRPEIAQRVTQPEVSPEEMAAVFVQEIEAKIDNYFILVLDDCHIAENSQSILRFFNALLASLPDQAQLILAGRGLPRLQL